MPEVVEIPIELTRFELPHAVQARLQLLLDRQDEGCPLSQVERQEAEGLVELAEFLSTAFVLSTGNEASIDSNRSPSRVRSLLPQVTHPCCNVNSCESF